jgi:hypothetical protein
MKNFLRLTGALVVTLAIALSSKEAHALGPVDIEVGAKVGAATNPGAGWQLNPLGFGAGGRVGVSIFGIYGGLNLIDYIGNNAGINSAHALEFGGELGYSIKISVLTIRPQVGFGNITFSDTYSGTALGFTASSSSNNASFYLEPGLTALITLGIFYFGVDANALIITAMPTNPPGGSTSTDTAFTMHGQVGLAF